jgi:hypothetical protein
VKDQTNTDAPHPALATAVVRVAAPDPTGTGGNHPAIVTRPGLAPPRR